MTYVRTAVIAATVLWLGLSTASQAADQVSLRLSWYIGGYHAAYYLGRDRGFYSQEGIDLSIGEGRGSTTTAQLVGSKADTFGISDSSSLILGAARGLPIRAVASLMNAAGFALLFFPESGIKTAADLKGRRVAMSPGDALTQLFPAVLKANRLERGDLNIVMLDPAGKQVALLEKRVDAMLGDVGAQGVILEEKGYKVASLRFGELGVETIGLVLHTHLDTIKDRSDLVRRFVRASVRSWELAAKEPDAAVDAVLRAKPDLPAATVKRQLAVFLSLMASDATRGKPVGFGALADWERTYNLFVELRDMKTSMKPADFFTNEFLPQQ